MVCAECMKMCCLGGKNSVVKGLIGEDMCAYSAPTLLVTMNLPPTSQNCYSAGFVHVHVGCIMLMHVHTGKTKITTAT